MSPQIFKYSNSGVYQGSYDNFSKVIEKEYLFDKWTTFLLIAEEINATSSRLSFVIYDGT